ncbi:Formate hydrogenlyase subunit [Trichinella pseudospiralis]
MCGVCLLMVSRLATVALGTPIPLLGTALCVDFNGCLCRLWTALSGFQWIDCSQCFLHRLPRYVNVSSQLSAVVETGVP